MNTKTLTGIYGEEEYKALMGLQKEELLQSALYFIAYNCKQGIYDPELFTNMNDEDLIKFYLSESDRGDAYANDNENFYEE